MEYDSAKNMVDDMRAREVVCHQIDIANTS